MGTNGISTFYGGINISTIDVLLRTTNTAFREADNLTIDGDSESMDDRKV